MVLPDGALQPPDKRIEPEYSSKQFGGQQVGPVPLTNVHFFVGQDFGQLLSVIQGGIVKDQSEKGKGHGIPVVPHYSETAVTADSRLVNDAGYSGSLKGQSGQYRRHPPR